MRLEFVGAVKLYLMVQRITMSRILMFELGAIKENYSTFLTLLRCRQKHVTTASICLTNWVSFSKL